MSIGFEPPQTDDTPWFYYVLPETNAQSEQVSRRQLLTLVHNGTLKPTTQVWCAGLANWEPMDNVPKLLNIDGLMTVLPPEVQNTLPRVDHEDYIEAWRNYSGGLGESISQAVTASTQMDGLYATQNSSNLMGDESESEHFTAQTDSEQDSDEEDEEEETENDSDEEEEEEEDEQEEEYEEEEEEEEESSESEESDYEEKPKKRKSTSKKEKYVVTDTEDESEYEEEERRSSRSSKKSSKKDKKKKKDKKEKKREKKSSKKDKKKSKKRSRRDSSSDSDDGSDSDEGYSSTTVKYGITRKLQDTDTEDESDDEKKHASNLTPRERADAYVAFNLFDEEIKSPPPLPGAAKTTTTAPVVEKEKVEMKESEYHHHLTDSFKSLDGCLAASRNVVQLTKDAHLFGNERRVAWDDNVLPPLTQYCYLEELERQYMPLPHNKKNSKKPLVTMDLDALRNDTAAHRAITPTRALYLQPTDLFVPTNVYGAKGVATLQDIQLLQIRRAHIFKYYNRPWFPIWCLGQYVVVAGKMARVIEFRYHPKRPYKMQFPLDLTKETSATTDVEMTLYLILAVDGKDDEWKSAVYPLSAISNTKITDNMVRQYAERVTQQRVIRNAVNAWFLSAMGQLYLTNKEDCYAKMLTLERQTRENVTANDLNCNLITLTPLAHDEHFGTRSTQQQQQQQQQQDGNNYNIKQEIKQEVGVGGGNQYGNNNNNTGGIKQEVDSNGMSLDGNNPNNNNNNQQPYHPDPNRGLSTNEILHLQAAFNSQPGTLEFLQKKYRVAERHIPMSQINSYSTHHVLSYFPNTYDVKRHLMILHFMQSERFPPRLRGYWDNFVAMMRKKRGWVNKETNFMDIASLTALRVRVLAGQAKPTEIKFDYRWIDPPGKNQTDISSRDKQQLVDILSQKIAHLQDERLKFEEEREKMLKNETVTKAGELNKRARITNKLRFNQYVEKNHTLSMVDMVYHENTEQVFSLIHDPKVQQVPKPFSTTSESVYATAASALNLYAKGEKYLTEKEQDKNNNANNNNDDEIYYTNFKRRRFTLGRVAAEHNQLCQLGALTQSLADGHRGVDYRLQPYKRFNLAANKGHHGMPRGIPNLPGLVPPSKLLKKRTEQQHHQQPYQQHQ